MGCLCSFFSRSGKQNPELDGERARPLYSWEQRDMMKNINKDNFILDNLNEQTIVRLPGSINGQQFIIQNCQKCTVYVFDHTGQIQIDDCIDCQILIGPVRGSVFIRDSKNCVLATVCQQFRTRDCHDLHVFLSCTSQPIIESSHNIRFACLTLNYDGLKEQYQTAGISPWNNNWSNIHDFTSIPDGKNFSLLDENDLLFKYLTKPMNDEQRSLNIDETEDTSVTPFTHGERFQNRQIDRCLLIIFHHLKSDWFARNLIRETKKFNIILIQTKQFQLNESSGARIFGENRTYQNLLQKGPVIGLEMAGDSCVEKCHQVLKTLGIDQQENPSVFVSSCKEAAVEELRNFHNFANMQMSV